MTGRTFLYGMAIPGVLALAALAAILLPAGAHLTWARLGIGFAAYLAVNLGGAAIGTRYALR